MEFDDTLSSQPVAIRQDDLFAKAMALIVFPSYEVGTSTDDTLAVVLLQMATHLRVR